MRDAAEPILQVENLHTWFFTDAGVVRAVDGVSFTLHPGETLGIVGESGSGKSVTAKSIIRLLEEPARIVEGTIRFRGRDMVHLSDEELRRDPRRRDRHGVPGPDDFAQSGAAHRPTAHRDDDGASAVRREGRHASAQWGCCVAWAWRHPSAR